MTMMIGKHFIWSRTRAYCEWRHRDFVWKIIASKEYTGHSDDGDTLWFILRKIRLSNLMDVADSVFWKRNNHFFQPKDFLRKCYVVRLKVSSEIYCEHKDAMWTGVGRVYLVIHYMAERKKVKINFLVGCEVPAMEREPLLRVWMVAISIRLFVVGNIISPIIINNHHLQSNCVCVCVLEIYLWRSHVFAGSMPRRRCQHATQRREREREPSMKLDHKSDLRFAPFAPIRNGCHSPLLSTLEHTFGRALCRLDLGHKFHAIQFVYCVLEWPRRRRNANILLVFLCATEKNDYDADAGVAVSGECRTHSSFMKFFFFLLRRLRHAETLHNFRNDGGKRSLKNRAAERYIFRPRCDKLLTVATKGHCAQPKKKVEIQFARLNTNKHMITFTLFRSVVKCHRNSKEHWAPFGVSLGRFVIVVFVVGRHQGNQSRQSEILCFLSCSLRFSLSFARVESRQNQIKFDENARRTYTRKHMYSCVRFESFVTSTKTLVCAPKTQSSLLCTRPSHQWKKIIRHSTSAIRIECITKRRNNRRRLRI